MAGFAAAASLAAAASAAHAVTLGTTTVPPGASAVGCGSGAFYTQAGTDSAYRYSVPPNGGQINAWSFNTTGATPATPITLLVLRANGGGYTIVGFDSETLPSSLPPGAVVSFPLAAPIFVGGGEQLGVYASPATAASCFFSGGSIPAAELTSSASVGPPSLGASYTPMGTVPGNLVNVSANLIQSQDAGIVGAATPPVITPGGVSAYNFTVSNGGVSSGPISVSDTVPSGLRIVSAVAGSGSCSTAGQLVTCTILNLPVASAAPMSIIVSAQKAGSYVDTAAVSTVPLDPNPANNSASATLTVSPQAAAPSCTTVELSGAPFAVARVVIPALNCTVGRIRGRTSRTVPRGFVILTRPGPGKTLAAGTAINLALSTGPPKRHTTKRKKKQHKKPKKKR